MTFACLYIATFPVQAVVRLELELRGRAVIIVEPEPPPSRVFALNEAARKAGAECGMSQVEVAGFKGVEVRRRSHAAEASAHAALLDLARSFSPRFEDVAVDTVVLDLAGLEALLGTAEEITQQLAESARKLGLDANVALASNPDTARLAARGWAGITLIGEGEEADRLSKLPVEVLAPPLEMQETLDRWGIRTFGALAALPAAELSERLGQEGIRLQRLARGGALRALVPTEEPLHFEEAMDLDYAVAEFEPLAFILGRLLNQLCARLAARGRATQELRLVLGVDASGDGSAEESQKLKVESQKSRINSQKSIVERQESISESQKSNGSSKDPSHCHSEEPQATRNLAVPPISEARFGMTRAHNFCPQTAKVEGNTTFNFQLLTFNFFAPRTPKPEPRSLCLPVPTQDPRLLLKLWLLDLEAHPPSAPVLKVAITAEPTWPRVAQGDLFLPRAPDPQKLELTLARLRGMVGEGKAGSPELLDTHRPDAFRMNPFEIREPVAARSRKSRVESRKPKVESQSKIENRNSKFGLPKPASHEFRISNFEFRNRLSTLNSLPRIPNPEPQTPILLRLFRPPLTASVEMQFGHPVRVDSAHVRGSVISAAGPWRTSGGWWTEDPWERDEWDVAIAVISRRLSVVSYPLSVEGVESRKLKVERVRCYRLYRDLMNGQWFVGGLYD